LDYGRRLAALRTELADTMEIVMRVYFEKPRTTIGWKGLINDPHLDGSNDIEFGLKTGAAVAVEPHFDGAAGGDGVSGPHRSAIH
jgi:3-deoxy-7-phosphoheptulonate synthase